MNTRARLLAVMDAYRVTGPAKQLLAAATPQAALNVTTTLGVFQRSAAPGPFITAARELGVPVLVIRDRFPGDPRMTGVFAGHARRADILQTHGYKANVLACVLRPWLGVPWIAFLHGETSENFKVRAYFRLERFAVRRADRVVAVSEAMARRLVREGVDPARVRVVHNACLVSSNGVPDGRPAAATVGVVARLSPEKGVDLALRAYAIVRTSCPDAELIIAGEGPERARLKRLATELGLETSVRWLGHVEDVSQIYSTLSVLLLPSRSEGFPNVVLEAMAHAVPVVAAAVGGVPEAVSDGNNGLLAPAGDVNRLAEGVVRVLTDGPLRGRLGRQARCDTALRFSLTTRLSALARLYLEVAR
jgi:glycosyltransferase involved in cell wall biosynthesis